MSYLTRPLPAHEPLDLAQWREYEYDERDKLVGRRPGGTTGR